MDKTAVRTFSAPFITKQTAQPAKTYSGNLRDFPAKSTVFIDDEFGAQVLELAGSGRRIVHLATALHARLCSIESAAVGKSVGFLVFTDYYVTGYLATPNGNGYRYDFEWRDNYQARHHAKTSDQPLTQRAPVILDCVRAFQTRTLEIERIGLWAPTSRLSVGMKALEAINTPCTVLPINADLEGALTIANRD